MDKNSIYIRRITKFVSGFVRLLQTQSLTFITKPLIEQAVRSSSSIGANYNEAMEAESKKDFLHKLGICKKETKETLYWIELIASLYSERAAEFRPYWKEARELLLIISSSINTVKSRSKAK